MTLLIQDLQPICWLSWKVWKSSKCRVKTDDIDPTGYTVGVSTVHGNTG